MKFTTLTLSTLIAILAVDAVPVRAEHLTHPPSTVTIQQAQRRKVRRRHGSKQIQRRSRHWRVRTVPYPYIQRRSRHGRHSPYFHPYSGRRYRRHHPFFHRHGRRHYPRSRYYPYVRRRSLYIYPFRSPTSEQQFSFPSQRTYIAPEHTGPEGQYDHQGLAKRVILGLVTDPELQPLVATLDIQQEGDSVLLAGNVPTEETLDKVIELIKNTKGAKSVDATKVVVRAPSASK